jgi:hypothetical protein
MLSFDIRAAFEPVVEVKSLGRTGGVERQSGPASTQLAT